MCIDFVMNGTAGCCASNDFLKGTQVSIKTPCGSQGLSLTAEAEIVVDDWTQVGIETYPYPNITKCYIIDGTSVDTHWKEYVCPSSQITPKPY